MKYTYSIYDSNPQESDGNCWPSRNRVPFDADSDNDARKRVQEILEIEAEGLSVSDGYAVGQRLYTTITRRGGIAISRPPTHVITEDDLA